ncbi:MAG: membrane protein insertase YidC [Pseudomonadota bacterium]
MKNLRAYLWIGLALILFVNFQAWTLEFGPRDAAAAAAVQQAAAAENAAHPLGSEVPQVPTAVPSATATAAPIAPAGAVPATATANTAPTTPTDLPAASTLTVRTDVLDVDINLRGGELTRADLLQYRVVKGGTEPVRLLRKQGAGNQFLLQTGLAGATSNPVADEYPTHLALFSSDYTGFRLEDGVDEVRVPLKWTSPSGVMVTKTLVFHRGSYRIDVEYAVTNDSAAPWSVAAYAQIQHDMPVPVRSFTNYFNFDSYSFTGPAYWDGTKYQKVKIDANKIADFNRAYPDGWKNGWIAALQHHFVTALVAPTDEQHRYSISNRGTEFNIRDIGPAVAVAPGATATLKQTLFIGPKLQEQLMAVHPQLGRATDYGVLTLVARPLFLLLEQVHKLFGNWGWAIIIVTLLLKLAMYPLSEISGRSAAKMKQMAPRMKQLQETYKDDRTKLGQATMELYKKEKINPAAGCLPQLIQIPIFMAFYWVLVESVEMRQAPFIGWLHDLSSRDPFFILPVLMAGAMFMQYRLQPPSADPVQAKVFMIMPLFLSLTFAFLPSGLVLYYVVNTLLSILQQWNINRRIAVSSQSRD